MSGHRIGLTIGGFTDIDAAFYCSEPDTADCRNVCEKPECEEGCVDYTAHRPGWTPVDYCNLVTWWTEGGTWCELYAGPLTEVRSGEIVPVRSSDAGVDWRYA